MSDNRWSHFKLVCFECGGLEAVEGGNCAECFAPMTAVPLPASLTGAYFNTPTGLPENRS